MADLFKGLNPAQREAVETLHGPLLVLAGAGTGKTKVITHRMAHLIAKGVEPGRILALTFTNKAAREMKERFIKLAQAIRDRKELNQLFAGTFHSFCVRILRKDIDRLHYKKNFSIYDESDQLAILRHIGAASSADKKSSELQRIKFLIGLAKNRGVEISEVSRDASLTRIAAAYQEELKLRNAVDFDDLLVLMLRLLREHSEVRDRLRTQYQYLLVDEYQDTNSLQFDIVQELASASQNVCVVGDDDQSIYSWRGAESSHILEFESHFPGTKIVRLEQNYRCTPNILEAANGVIKNNARRHAKTLWSEGKAGDFVRLTIAETEEEEAEWIASDILKKRRDRGMVWERFAVLYRANHLSRVFEQQFRRMRIPYRVVGGQAFFERREVKDILSYIQVAINPDDDTHLLRVIGTPARGIGKTTIHNLIHHSRERGRSVWKEIRSAQPGTSGQTHLYEFAQLIKRYAAKFAQPAGWGDSLRQMLEEIDYFHYLKTMSRDSQELSNRRENVEELVSALTTFEEKKEGSLSDFLDRYLLDKDQDEEEQGYGVTLMTLHSAKGLEFPVVYIVGLEEGILPHDRSKQEGTLDEERRLFYVGMTRAKESLTLSQCSARKRYGQLEPRHPSSFLSEVPSDVVETVMASDSRKEVDAGEAVSRLKALRQRLASS